MNVTLEQGEEFWLDFKHGVLEWKASDDEQSFGDEKNIMISSSDQNLKTAKKELLQSRVKNKVYTQGQPRICTRWVYTYKKSQ